MKLLGWMHCRFRSTSGDVFKDLGGGGTCNCLAGRPSLDEDPRRSRRQYEPFKARSLRLDAEVLFDGDGGSGGGDPAMEVLFGGLLTVGTLGTGSWPIEEKGEEDDAATNGEVDEKKLMVLAVEELVTPAALEAIAEEEAEATERDLTVVGAELEKVLPTEAEKGGGGMSSARSSHSGAAACPLQGLLFGSPIETASAVAGGRKERRASLGELIMMSRIAEGGGVRAEEAEVAGLDSGRDGERKPTAEMCMMRTKIAKHRNGSDGGGVSTNGSTVETKIQKILQIFHRKVHPESGIMTKKASKTVKIEKNDHTALVGGNDLSGTGGSTLVTLKVAAIQISIGNTGLRLTQTDSKKRTRPNTVDMAFHLGC
ncbi:hypothetical protein OPV22_019529 [Ensete ventricosum]|uniref:Uncharacterized protein n=1 Tax=Ensete ventricosum TaxID=4639 RepID=A0AAV8QJC6_ENSVE|nr:hypothetical protein OPV22_019529 [Ensete ventricosum]